MKPTPPKKLKADSKYAMILARYPVRLLHDVTLGVLLGGILAIGLQSLPHDHATPIVHVDKQIQQVPIPAPTPSLRVVASPGTENDLDGDGIPNDWEIAHSHNPNNAADAASDFDSDGLTTLQEFELWNRTNGLVGNPLGKWTTQEIPFAAPEYDPQEYNYYYQDSYIGAANDAGDTVIQFYSYGEKLDGSWFNETHAVFLHAEGNQQIISIPGKSSGSIYASDINDRGDVLLQWYSEDGSTYESYILKSDQSLTQLTLHGNPCYAYRMNNFGDWIGYEITTSGEWKSVQVVNGVNALPNDIFTSWYYFLDINDYGQAIGSYYDVMEDNYLTFTQLGTMFFSTGRAGDNPTFNQSTNQWQWPAALNQWGEFAGGAYGQMPNGQYRNSCFFYDGKYREVSPQDNQNYSWPSGLSDTGMILLTSYSYAINKYTSHLWKDSVSVDCADLMPEGSVPNNDAFLYASYLTPKGKIYLTRYDANWQVQSLITLTPNQDTDGDGMPDDWEEFYGFNPYANDGFLDYDNDGTNNLGEFLLRSDPRNPPVFDPNDNVIDMRPGVDTDGDGIPNNWEVVNGMNYDDKYDAPLDFDRDGYTNLQEYRLNTDPRGAPSYRIRKLGPFPGTSSVDLTNTNLGNGVVSGNPTYFSGDQITEQVFFKAWTSDGVCKPAVWSQARTDSAGQFSFYASSTPISYEILAQSLSGAMLTRHGYYPVIYSYWSSPSAEPITLSSQMDSYDINNLYNVTFSPSGNYLFAVRSLDSETSVYEPIVWKMPSSDNITYSPLILSAPVGASFNAWTTAYINDYGIITSNGTVDEQNRPLVWSFNEAGTAMQSSIMPALPGGSYASVVGLSNHSMPIIAGTANNGEGQERATVWKYNNPTAITASDLGTLKNGNYSQISKISPNGTLAGMANTLANDALEYRIFSAAPVIPAEASSIDPSLYSLTPQEESSNWSNITDLVDSGELLATTYDPTTYQAIRSLTRHGRSHSLEEILPPSSGYTLDSIKSINAHGTLLVTAWKDNLLETLLLTPDQDTDGDGLPDAFENANQFNAFVKNNPSTDTDNDGLTDLLEFANGTNPRLADSDSDGMQDGWEISWGLNPLDATDANLDPDGDRVTNLRESQINTNPTGIYRTDVIYTDEEYTNSYPSKIFDNGKLILSTYDFSNYETDTGSSLIQRFSLHNKLISYPSVNENNAEVVITQAALPSNRWEYHYDYAWNWLGSKEQRYTFYFDPTTNHINADSYNYDNQNYGDGSYTWSLSQTGSLQPDILTPDLNDTSSPFATPIIVSNFNSYGTADGNYYEESNSEIDYLEENEILYPSSICTSPNGRHRIYATSNGRQIHLNEKGELVEVLPNNDGWTHINNDGVLIRYENEYVEETSDTPAHYLPKIIAYRQEYGYMTYDLTATSEDSAILNYPSIIQFSDDQKILLSQYEYQNGSYRVNFYLADLATQTLKKVKSPGLGNEYITHLSTTNGRMVGNGTKSWQITPDGTCIRLEALRIQNSFSGPQQTLKSLYPQAINPVHIAPDGSITATTYDSQWHQQIIRIAPNNDANSNGMSDDWETGTIQDYSHMTGANLALLNALINKTQILAASDDLDGDGYTAQEEEDAGTSDGNAEDADTISNSPVLFGRTFMKAWDANRDKDSAIREFSVTEETPPNPPVSPTVKPTIPAYYMQSVAVDIYESTYQLLNYKWTYTREAKFDRVTNNTTETSNIHREGTEFLDPGSAPMGYPWGTSKRWEPTVVSSTHTNTKTNRTSTYNSSTAPAAEAVAWGVSPNLWTSAFSSTVTLSNPYSSQMLLADTLDELSATQTASLKRDWAIQSGQPTALHYSNWEESDLNLAACQYAYEPTIAAADQGSFRLAWLEATVTRAPDLSYLPREERPEFQPEIISTKLKTKNYRSLPSWAHDYNRKTPKTSIHELNVPEPGQETKFHPICAEATVSYSSISEQLIDPSNCVGYAPRRLHSSVTWNMACNKYDSFVLTKEFDVPIVVSSVKNTFNSVKIWRRTDDFSIAENGETVWKDKYERLILPITIQPSDSNWGGDTYLIEYMEPGDFELQVALKTKSGLVVSSHESQNYSIIDLDVDSDNTGVIDHTLAEDAAETTAPGKYMLTNPDADENNNNIPNFADFTDAGKFTEITLKTEGFKTDGVIVFHYEANDPSALPAPVINPSTGITTYQKGTGSIRIWKKDGQASRHKVNDFIKSGKAYTVAELGMTEGVDQKFYVEKIDNVGITYIGVATNASTYDALSVNLVGIDIEEVISDQIAGNEANKLPTKFYIGAPNNPMLMATRSGVNAHLRVLMNAGTSAVSNILVGARKVGSTPILGSVASVPAPGKTLLNFDAYDGHHIYEIVAGYDANANGALETSEVAVVFEKTPKTASSGAAVTSNLGNMDKIIIVTQSGFDSGKWWATANNIWGTDYTGDLISAFAHGSSTVAEGTTTTPHLITSTQRGLSHPVGAKWNAALTSNTHMVSFYDGSEAAEDVKSSYALDWLLRNDLIAENLAAIKAASSGNWKVLGPYAFSKEIDFKDTEKVGSNYLGVNELGYAFGKVKITGAITVNARWAAGGKIEIGTVWYSGQFDDIYDFSYWAGWQSREASLIQAGHATLAGSVEPDAGKVFFTRVVFNGSKEINQEF